MAQNQVNKTEPATLIKAASTASIAKDGDGYVLENRLLKAKIYESAKWGIFSLIDQDTNNEVLDWGPDFAPANDLIFYRDGGERRLQTHHERGHRHGSD